MSGRYLLDTNIMIALFADEVAVKDNLAMIELDVNRCGVDASSTGIRLLTP